MHIFINALWIFFMCAFFGWIWEVIQRLFKRQAFVNIGFIATPFSPYSGLVGVVIYLFFSRFENIAMVFLGSVILLTVLKAILAKSFEKVFGFKWIDNDKKYSLNGYVTIKDALLNGVVSVLLVCYLIPLIKKIVASMSPFVALLVASIIVGIIVADLILSCSIVFQLKRNLKQMSNISSILGDENFDGDEEKLLAEYEKKLVKNKTFRKRLIKAFPNMEFADYEKQFDDLRIKLNLIREKNDKVYETKIINKEAKPFAYGLSFYKLFWLFFVGSFLGTILETIWAYLKLGSFEIRTGLVWGPFIPVYGGGAILITLCLYKLYKANDLAIYLASAVIGATFEYFCSYFQETFLGTISWDYSGTLFNLNGRTNLMFALIWGLLGLSWLRYIYPFFSRNIEKIPKKIGNVVTVILIIFMVVNCIVSFGAVYRCTQRHKGIAPLTKVGVFMDKCFDDEYMEFIYPNMVYPERK